MKVMFINPGQSVSSTALPEFVSEETGKYPPLGLLYIMSSAEKSGLVSEMKLVDTLALNIAQKELENEILKFAPDIVAIQMMTFSAVDAYQCACTAKKVNPEIYVVVGGPHPNIYVEETLLKNEIDCIVLGEGEETFVELLRCFKKNDSLEQISHIAYRKEDGTIKTGTPGKINDLNTLPFPARKYLDLDIYYTVIGVYKRMTTIVSTRGCPFRCLFCDRAYWGKIYRKRSPENVVDEIEECMSIGIEEFDFQDDTFTIDKKRAMGICDEIIKRKLKITWNIRSRVDAIDEELLEKLAQAGVARIYYGVESGSPEIIKVLRKDIDLDKAMRVFRSTKKAGIQTLAYFMIVVPSETRKHIQKTMEYISKLDPDFLHLSILMPLPNTDLYTLGLETGQLPFDYWKEYAKNLNLDFTPYFWEENLNRDELQELQRYVYKAFYFRPKYIIKQLLSLHGYRVFFNKAKAGISMLKYLIR